MAVALAVVAPIRRLGPVLVLDASSLRLALPAKPFASEGGGLNYDCRSDLARARRKRFERVAGSGAALAR